MASAVFGQPSGKLTERADHPTARGTVAAEGGHIFLGQGSVPIIRNGTVSASAAVQRSRTRIAPRCGLRAFRFPLLNVYVHRTEAFHGGGLIGRMTALI